MSFESQTHLVKGIRINTVIDLHVRSVSEGVESAVHSSFSSWRSIKTRRGEETTRMGALHCIDPNMEISTHPPHAYRYTNLASFDCPMSLHGEGSVMKDSVFSIRYTEKQKEGVVDKKIDE